MKVLCRSRSGQWVKWRVGRRRAVWIGGGPTGLTLIEFADVDSEYGILLYILVPLWWLFRLTFFLLATAVMWPLRALTGRWTVVAYELTAPEDRPVIRRKVRGRKAADALAREWAAAIERDGGLFLPEVSPEVPAPEPMAR